MTMYKADRDLLKEHSELIEFLGGDVLATRAAGFLARKEKVHTVADLMRLYAWGRDYLLDVTGLGPKSVDRIVERCVSHVPALRNGGRSTE